MLELTLVVLIVSVLVVLAFERIAALRAEMERASVQQTVAAMQTALALEFARRASLPDTPPAAGLVGANALRMLDPPPSGYQPRARHADWEQAPHGTWFFDPERGAMVYRASVPAALPGDGERPIAAWKARAEGRDLDGDGTVEPGTEPVTGIRLVRLPPG
jgi:type II secretory pathway pseudopilin PulG